MKRRVVILKTNMWDDEEREIFQAEIPYEVKQGKIESEDSITVTLDEIWVDFDVRFLD